MINRSVVISQSMYFPWVGFLEQIKLSDVFVQYDDVQFSKGSFSNRVQVKNRIGISWLTIPLQNLHMGQKIDEVQIDESKDWRSHHRNILRQCYYEALFYKEMIDIVDKVFSLPVTTLADVSCASQMELAKYFGLVGDRVFFKSHLLGIEGSSSQRVLNIVLKLNGSKYITGHGAQKYLDHSLFESAGISVEYMQYRCISYPQMHGEFNPYVSALDLVANCGKEGTQVIQSGSTNWDIFIKERNNGKS